MGDKMLTYNLDNKEKVPLYVSLYNRIKADILAGKIMPEEKLPSKRSLARHLKISIVTVESAYAQLLLEGYVNSIEKKGYYVNKLDNAFIGRFDKKDDYSKIVFQEVERQGILYDFKSTSINAQQFPFSVWARLMRETLSEQDTRLLEAMPANGIMELQKAIAQYLYQFRGMNVSPEQIYIGSGTEYLYNLIIQLLGRNKVYAIEDPGYKKIAKVYERNDIMCEHIGLDNNGMSVAQLKSSNADIAHISPAHHFPTGIVMPISRRHELLAWAKEKESRYILEDDYDSEFRFLGRPIETLQSIDSSERVIYINTFSKSIAPSVRISYMVLPRHLMEIYNRNLSFYSCTVPSFEQLTLSKFITKGHFERHIYRMRLFYKKQRDLILDTVRKSSISDRVTIYEENAGLHFLMEVKTEMSDQDIVKKANKKGILISCLSEYYYDKKRQTQSILIINYSGIKPEQAVNATKQLISIFES